MHFLEKLDLTFDAWNHYNDSLHPFVTHPKWGKKQDETREAHPLNLKLELFEE